MAEAARKFEHDKGDGGRGRGAETPAQIPARGWRDILLRTWEEISRDRILLVAAGVTFYALLALVPALGAFVALYGLFFDPAQINGHVSALDGFLPPDAVQIMRDQTGRIAAQGSGTLSLTFAISLAISLWSAMAGVKAIIDALNIAYEEEEKRSFLALNAQALALTLGAIAFIIVALAGLVAVPAVLNTVGLGWAAGMLISLGRWPALIAALVLALAVLYRWGPSRRKPQWRWITWGSAAATTGWVAFSLLFTWYLANFANYNKTYGSLGAVVALMTWLWLSITIVLVGAELNAEIEHQTARDTTEGTGERPMGRRGAEMADTVGEAKG